MGRIFRRHLECVSPPSMMGGSASALSMSSLSTSVSLPLASHDGVYSCSTCAGEKTTTARGSLDRDKEDTTTHFVRYVDLISRQFQGRHGKAYLFDNVVNVLLGEPEERVLMTGLHTVCDITCVACGTVVGWKYLSAAEPSQRYKEGRYILERAMILSEMEAESVAAERQVVVQRRRRLRGGDSSNNSTMSTSTNNNNNITATSISLPPPTTIMTDDDDDDDDDVDFQNENDDGDEDDM
eukprot:PhM_4_TR12922/c1_g1_i1/m.2515